MAACSVFTIRLMKRITTVVFAASTLLFGCDTAFKYENYIQSLYRGGISHDTVSSPITCFCEMPETFESAVNVTEQQSAIVELNNYNYECEMNPRVPFEIFSRQSRVSAQSQGLIKLLGNRHLDLYLISAPGSFRYVRMRDHYNYLIATRTEFSQSIYPTFTKLRFTYKLREGSSVTKSGDISLDDNGDALGSRGWDWKVVTKGYLFRYEEKLKSLTDESIKMLTKEIQKG